MPDPRTYLDDQGREMFVSDGLSRGRTWGTYRRKPTGSLERFVSKSLPLRPTQGKAQRDLDDRAGRKGWRAAGETEQAKGERTDVREPVYGTIGLTEVDVTKNIRTTTTASPELIASVQKRGLDKPVLVRLAPADSACLYEMMDGHRRWHAAKACGHDTIPARIFDLTDREYREIQLECAGLHEDLDPLDRARALKRLIDEHGLTQAEAGALVEGGRTQGWVSKQLALLEMASEVHDFIRRGILSGSAAEEFVKLKDRPEMLGDLVKDLERAESPLTVGEVRQKIDNAIWAGGKSLDELDPAGCKGCASKTKVQTTAFCLDLACWEVKRQAHFDALQASAVAGEKPVVVWNTAPDALATCPEDCPDAGMVFRFKGVTTTSRACFRSESECYKARQAELRARGAEIDAANRKLRAEGDAIREAEQDAREAAREERLNRVALYLRERQAKAPEGLTGPEARLACCALLSGFDAQDYVRRVLDLDLDDDETRGVVERLAARELGTLTVGYLLADTVGVVELGEVGESLREAIMSGGEMPALGPACFGLDPERLARPMREGSDQGDCDGGPDSLCDDCRRDICPRSKEEEPATPDPEVNAASPEAPATPKCDRGGNCRACGEDNCNFRDTPPDEAPRVIDLRANPPEPSKAPAVPYQGGAVKRCPFDGIPLSPEACGACCGRKRRDTGECCPGVTGFQAPFVCGVKERGPGKCPPRVLEVLERDAREAAALRELAHPEFEDADAAVADAMAILSDASEDEDEPTDEPELAPLPIEKASYGANPAVTVCPLSGQPRSAGECLACCRKVVHKFKQPGRAVQRTKCCACVTSGQAPFHCPGGLDQCPVAVDGEEPEDKPAPITICPVEKVTRTAEHCRGCCRDNKPTDGCCKRVVDGEAPFSCDGVECPAPEVEEAPTEDAPAPTSEAPAPEPPAPAPEAPAAWTCPDYGEVVEPDFCRTCNAERPANGCCPHVLAGSAPFKCADCAPPKDGCQAKGVA